MCILLKLHYAKFDVSRLFCSNVIKEKPLGGRVSFILFDEIESRMSVAYAKEQTHNICGDILILPDVLYQVACLYYFSLRYLNRI